MEMMFSQTVYLAVFTFSIFMAIYLLIGAITSRRGKSESSSGDGGGVRISDELEWLAGLSPLFSAFKPLSYLVVSRMASEDIDKVEHQLSEAGVRRDLSIEEYIGLRLISAVAGAGLGAFFGTGMLGPGLGSVLLGGVGMAVGWVFPSQWLSQRTKTRRAQIFRGLSTTLDILSISVQAGLELPQAFEEVVSLGTEPLLDRELSQTLHEMNEGGKSLDKAFEDMSERVGVPELTAFCNVVVMAYRLGGGGTAQLMLDQSEGMRTERVLRAEKQVNEMPSKILLPIALFIFPAVIASLLGPLILRAVREFGG